MVLAEAPGLWKDPKKPNPSHATSRDTAELCEEQSYYDAIISDPPYNLRAPVFVDGALSGSQDPRPAADLTAAVIALSGRLLSPGGRLVLFVPARGAEIDLTLEALLEKRMGPGASAIVGAPGAKTAAELRVVHGRLQRFSTRRSRRAGSSASPRASFVMLLCISFMNLLSMFTSYVRRRPYPSIRSQSTKVGSYATSQAFWWTRTFEEHDGVRFAEGPACRRPSNVIKRRLLVMPMRARRRLF